MKYITFILVSILLFSCKSNQKHTAETEEHEILAEDIVEMNADQYKMAGIELGRVEYKTLSNILKVNGIITVSPQNIVSVCAPLGGFVKNTSMVEGSMVKKGQVLVMLDNPEFIELQKNYLETRSRLEFAESEYQRHQDLYKDEVYSKKSLQQVTADYKSLKIQVNALSQKLSLIGVDASKLDENHIRAAIPMTAPINGFVRTININIGKYVTPTDVMFEIVNTSELTIELTLFEKDIHKISPGLKLWFSFLKDENKRYEAVISQVGKAITSDKTIKAYAIVKYPSGNLLPGMYVNANIETANNRVTSLPASSIVRFDEKDYIFVYEREKKEGEKEVTEFRFVEVKRGVSDGGFTEVILPDNFDLKKAKIVIKGAHSLLSAKKNAGDMAC